jgi:hypothetical protein
MFQYQVRAQVQKANQYYEGADCIVTIEKRRFLIFTRMTIQGQVKRFIQPLEHDKCI